VDKVPGKALKGEITNLDDLNAVLRSMIKDVVEAAMGAEMTGFLGYDRYQTPESDPGNRQETPEGYLRFRGTHPFHVCQGDEYPRYPAPRQGNLQPGV
jgi:hypothetical protein